MPTEPPSAKPIASAPIWIAQLATEMRGAAAHDREHQAVARPGAEARADVERAREADHGDAGDVEREARRRRRAGAARG